MGRSEVSTLFEHRYLLKAVLKSRDESEPRKVLTIRARASTIKVRFETLYVLMFELF